jgi:hypothetical protein
MSQLAACPIVLANDSAYLANDPLACAGSKETIDDFGLIGPVILTKPAGK